ncbi:MAG: ATP-binding protein [bacterium]
MKLDPNTLNKLNIIGNSSLNLKRRLSQIALLVTEVLKVDVCSICMREEKNDTLILKATIGLNPELIDNLKFNIGVGVAGLAFEKNEPTIVKNPTLSDVSVFEKEPYKSILAVPLSYKNAKLGVLVVQTPEIREFNQEDVLLLTTLVSKTTGLIRNAQLHSQLTKLSAEKETRVRELSLLYDIGKAMRSTMKLDTLLNVILTVVTMGGGMGFNRAVLLLINERTNVLQGMMGVGPSSAEEAYAIWEEIKNVKGSLINNILSEDVGKTIIFNNKHRMIENNQQTSSDELKFDKLVKGIRIPLDRDHNVLVKTVLEKKVFNIKEGDTSLTIEPEITNQLGAKNFATIPLIAKNKVIGVILVDNLYNNKPILDEDLAFLKMFTIQAGLAIESTQLYQSHKKINLELQEIESRLLQTEKFAALGEMAANVAHEIRNPLVTIGGFARRLNKTLNDKEPEGRYSNIIVNEVTRLENLVQDVLSFSKETPPSCEEHNINELLEDTLRLFSEDFKENRVEIIKKLFTTLPPVSVDSKQLKQVFTNLLYNALYVMPNGGQLWIKTYLINEELKQKVVIEIGDTGGGIPLEVIDNIFNPFFTTKSTGTGLGLALARKIVENHGGTIEVDNRVGEGVNFIIKLMMNDEIKKRRK